MTPDRQPAEGLKLPAWAIPILLSAFTALTIAWTALHGKEDAADHKADVATLRDERKADVQNIKREVDSMRYDTRTTAVRDSAWKADAMRILLDVQRQVKK